MNSGYSAADIYAMQKEAEQRVFEMQRRARRTLELEEEQEKKPRFEPERKAEQRKNSDKPQNNFEQQHNIKSEPKPSVNPQEQFEAEKNELKNAFFSAGESGDISESGLVNFLMQDKESALIALLLLILIRENADESVILVLLYLILFPNKTSGS